MRLVQIGSQPVRRPPVPDAPEVELVLDGTQNGIAVARIEIPVGAGMPEHSHGDSAVVLLSRSGRLRIRADGEEERTLEPGGAAAIGVGERVSLHNPGPEPVILLAVFAPPDFAAGIAAWPATA